MSGEAKAAIIAAIIGAVATLLCTFITVYQPLKSDTDTLTKQVAQLKSEISDLKKENSELREKNSGLEKENAQLRERLNIPVPDKNDETTSILPPPGDAIAISSASELYSYITSNMSGSFYLTQDIDMTAKDWNDKWTPLGRKSDSEAVAFTGTLDGQGHAIRNVQNSGSSLGLFEILSGTVRNLHIDAQFTCGDYGCGGAFAVSMTEDGTIENCYASGKIDSGNSSTIGSFAGNVDKGVILNCLSTAGLRVNVRIGSSATMGGIVGKASGATITDCLFKGTMYPWYRTGIIGNESDCAVNSCHYYYGDGYHTEIPARLRQQVTYTDWDWGVWAIDSDVNDGFPYLRAFEAEFQKT